MMSDLCSCCLSVFVLIIIRTPSNSIQVANVDKGLGVLMDNFLSPSVHCKEAAYKARRMLFMIKHSFAELCVPSFAPLYNTLVGPHLENAMQAYSPNLVADTECLEQFQR